MTANQLQIAYLPYISMASQDEIQVDRVRIWNYSTKADEYIRDVGLRAHIDKIIRLNVHRGTQIRNIGIVSIGDIDFRPFGEDELQDIHEACIILFLSFLSYQMRLQGDNVGFFMRTAENFRCVIQNFVLGDKHIAERSGTLINITDFNLISKISIHKPSYVVLNEFAFSHDIRLLENLVGLKRRGIRLYSRIIRASEIFRQSYYNSEDVSIILRVLFQMAAFETLLGLGQPPRKNFKDLIENYCNLPNDRKFVHSYLDHGRKRSDVNRTMKGKWAESFYQLRNRIIHGDKLKGKPFKFREKMFHFDIATMFFIVLMKKLINENLRRKIFDEDILWNRSEKVFEYVDRSISNMVMQGLKKEIKEAKRAAHRRN
jgi:hypothetical protein